MKSYRTLTTTRKSTSFFLDMINSEHKKVYIGGCLDYHF